MSLNGRTVLITGAARGIGAETARVLARRGARLALVGLEPERLEALAGELGEQHHWQQADVTDGDSLAAAVAGSVERLGGLDVAVANAGIATYGTIERFDPEAFARTIEINLTGVFRTLQATAPHLIERRGYALVIASVASFAPLPGMSAYSASKAGAESVASAFSVEVARHGVAVGSAHPSWIDTDMVRAAEDDLGSFRELRSRLPWPFNKTTSVRECAEAIADGIERRAPRIYVPRSAVLGYWTRALIQSPLGLRAMRRQAARTVPRLEAEVEALGRSMGEHAEAAQRGEPARR